MNDYNVINNLPFGFDFYNRSQKELKKYSELGVTRFFAQSQERQEEEAKELLKQLEELEGNS